MEGEVGTGENLRDVGEHLLEGLQIRGAAEEVAEDFAFDGVHEVNEHRVGVVFIFHERIFLAEGAEVNGVAESIHRIEVLLPEAVDGVEDDVALEAAQGVGIFEGGFALVGVTDGLDEEICILLDGACVQGGFLLGETERKGCIDPVEESIVVGFVAFGRFKEGRDFFRNDLVDDFEDEFAWIIGVHDFVAVAVDDFALLVHDIVKLEGALAHHVIPLLDAFLCGFHAAVQPGVLEFLAFLEAEGFHDFGHAVAGAEVSHEVVLEAHVEAGAAGIALAGAAASELAVDAAGFMALGAEHEEAANFSDALAEFDVGATAGHVG